MSPEATVADASVSGAAPGTGAAGSTGGSGAATSTADALRPTDDQILGLDQPTDQSAEPAAKPAEQQPADTGASGDKPQPTDQQPDQQAAEQQPDLTAPFSVTDALKANPQLKEWMKADPTVRRAMYGYESVVKAFGSPKDAHEVAEKITELGGRQGLDEILEGDARIEALIEAEDPEAREELLTTFHSERPEQINRFMADMPRVWAKLDPDGWFNHASRIIESVLVGQRTEVLNVLRQAQAAGNQERAERLEQVLAFIDEQAASAMGRVPWKDDGKSSGANAQIDAARQKLNADSQKFYGEQFQASRSAVNSAIENSIRTQITSELKAKLPTLEGEPLKDTTDLVWQTIDNLAAQDQSLVASVQAIRKALEGKAFDGARVSKLAEQRANEIAKLIPKALAKVLGIRAAGIRKEVQERKDKIDTAAKRVDITGGAPQTVKPETALTVKQMRDKGLYRQMDDDAILNQ